MTYVYITAVITAMVVLVFIAAVAEYTETRRSRKCVYVPRGWRCKIGHHAIGSCPAYPAWWNFRAKWRSRNFRKWY